MRKQMTGKNEGGSWWDRVGGVRTIRIIRVSPAIDLVGFGFQEYNDPEVPTFWSC